MSDLTPAEEAAFKALGGEEARVQGVCDIGDLATVTGIACNVVAAVQPIIAAQVLRDMAATLDKCADTALTGHPAMTQGIEWSAGALRHRATELEENR
jgi:hypothetical protein